MKDALYTEEVAFSVYRMEPNARGVEPATPKWWPA